MGNGLALTLLIFGVVGLFAYLASSGQRTLALGVSRDDVPLVGTFELVITVHSQRHDLPVA